MLPKVDDLSDIKPRKRKANMQFDLKHEQYVLGKLLEMARKNLALYPSSVEVSAVQRIGR